MHSLVPRSCSNCSRHQARLPFLNGLALFFSLVVLLLFTQSAIAAEWDLQREENGITIYTRPVPNSGIREFKGIAEVDHNAKMILALLRDIDRFKTWFPNTPESKLVERDGDVSVQYSVMDAPWPVSDRDNVLRSVTSHDDETGQIQIQVAAAPDAYPEQPDRVRVKKAKGSWILEPLSELKTRVTFQMHLEPGGGIPEWLTNARVVDSPFEALTNMREVLSR
jgi:ribosome-associated toxin RatA of RatAB toxin-antitoxin module